MKKIWLLTTLLVCGLLLTWCNKTIQEPEINIENTDENTIEFNIETEEWRIAACEERAGFYLNFNEWTFTWENEEETGASFFRNGHVKYIKRWEAAEDDVECFIDMVDWSINVDFTNHMYNGELQNDEEVITYSIVWPENWFEKEINEWELVLRWEFEDHTDIIFIKKWQWESYLDSNNINYGDKVTFKWELTSIDWAAWTHYYEAETVENLSIVS